MIKNELGVFCFMRVKKGVILLGLASLFNDIGSEIIAPVLPFLITMFGGSGVELGIIGGFREGLSSLLKVFSGYFSDKFGKKKPFVFSGYFVSAFSKLGLFFSKTWQHILVFVSFDRVGKGVRDAPRDAMISSLMPKEKGKGFGVHRALDTSGAVIGSIIAFALLFSGVNLMGIVLVGAVVSFLSLFPVLAVKEGNLKKSSKSFIISIKSLSFNLKVFLLVVVLFYLANFSYMFFMLKARTLGLFAPVLLYVISNVFYAGLSIPSGYFFDKFGWKVLAFGYFVFALTCIGFAFNDSFAVFVLLFALYGFSYALIDGNHRAMISELSSSSLRGTALGVYHTTVGLVAIPSSIIAGILWNVNSSYPFFFSSLVSICALILILALSKHFK